MNQFTLEVLTMAMAVVGGLGIFMLGMKYMSEGMQAVAGQSLRRMISMVTDNRLLATGTGTTVTVLVQSSTISTVIMVGLVNAGLMKLHQAVGFIMGANIGTTVTGWILLLKIGRYGLPILGIAALVFIFARRDRVRFIGMAVMGLGMIFFGLELMKQGVEPMKDIPQFREAFLWFAADTYLGILKCIIVGCLLTFLVQSSSATLAITISLVATGAIPFSTAAALILGENIGTTITVMIASVGANTNAKRAAYAHVLFNVIGVTWIFLLFPWYVILVSAVVESVHGANPMTIQLLSGENDLVFSAIVTAGVALTHTGFNVTNTLVFLPFLKPFTRLLMRIVPDPVHKEIAQLKHLDARSVDAPVLGVEQSRGEVIQMGRGVIKMLDWTRELAFNGPRDERLIEKTFHREQVLDNIEREIVAFLTEVLDGNVPHAVAEEGREQLRIAHEYESFSDVVASILKGYLKLSERGLDLPADQREQLLALHDEVAEFVGQITYAYENRQTLEIAKVKATSAAITQKVKFLRDDHMQRMIQSSVDPALTMVYTAQLTHYRRARAHAVNIHDAMVGKKAQPKE